MSTPPVRATLRVVLAPLLVSLTTQAPCPAHDDPQAPVPALRALRVEAPLTVDGRLDEPFWRRAEIAGHFIDSRSGRPAAQQTRLRIAYTRRDLYIAVECLDDHMEALHATEMREDRFFRGDDWIELHLDPAHSHNAKYAFFSNPLGTRVDASEGPSGSFSTSWSAEWDLAASIQADRWCFEMRIPLAILNYTRADDQTWGLNVTRKLVRTDVTSFWSYSETDSYKPRHFGHLTDLDLADSVAGRNLEVTPYVSAQAEFNGRRHTTVTSGADVNVRLSPSVTSSATFNPDFAQVEADADTIELRDTERFLPEKRLFFREGEDLFRGSRDLLYYSRRLTDIDAGARISGTWRRNKFTALDVYGDVVNGDAYHGNSGVFRLIHDVGQQSNLGVHASTSHLDEGHSQVVAHDGNLYLSEDWRVRYQLAALDERLRDEAGALSKDRDDYYGYTSLNYERYPWDTGVSYRAVTEGFNPAIGFIPRRDVFGPRAWAAYGLRASDRWYKSLRAELSTVTYDDHQGDLALRDYGAEAGLTFANDVGLEAEHEQDYHRPFRNHRTRLDLTLNDSDYYRVTGLGWAFGTFENTPYDEFVLTKHLQPIRRWPIRYEYVVRFEETAGGGRDTIWLNRVVFDLFFTQAMWLKSSLQHRSSAIHNLSLIYGWEFVKDAHVYLVYNNVREEDEPQAAQGLFLKTAYTFR